MKYCVVTTINYPTKAIEKLYDLFGNNLLIVEDNKTPRDWEYKDIQVVGGSGKMYAPYNHYARKNLGYLEAIRNGATCITDTDDDNIPNENWKLRDVQVQAVESKSNGWLNVYDLLSEEHIWPRGFSLRELNSIPKIGFTKFRTSSIQQGLADGEPDVDAIWRLVFNKQITFEKKCSIYLNPNTWCPFNSQSTWWFPKAYPLMYLPITSSFRMTDIWRSFIAQKCLWEIGEGVTFHSPSEVFQDRNEHDLLKDFEDEVPGYLQNDLIVDLLSKLELKSGEENVCSNMHECYSALVQNDILPSRELVSLKEWIIDYENAITNL